MALLLILSFFKNFDILFLIVFFAVSLIGKNIPLSIFLYSIYLFIFISIYLFWVFVAARGLSLVGVSRGYSSLRCAGFSLRWPLVAEHRL